MHPKIVDAMILSCHSLQNPLDRALPDSTAEKEVGSYQPMNRIKRFGISKSKLFAKGNEGSAKKLTVGIVLSGVPATTWSMNVSAKYEQFTCAINQNVAPAQELADMGGLLHVRPANSARGSNALSLMSFSKHRTPAKMQENPIDSRRKKEKSLVVLGEFQ